MYLFQGQRWAQCFCVPFYRLPAAAGQQVIRIVLKVAARRVKNSLYCSETETQMPHRSHQAIAYKPVLVHARPKCLPCILLRCNYCMKKVPKFLFAFAKSAWDCLHFCLFMPAALQSPWIPSLALSCINMDILDVFGQTALTCLKKRYTCGWNMQLLKRLPWFFNSAIEPTRTLSCIYLIAFLKYDIFMVQHMHWGRFYSAPMSAHIWS